MGLYVLFFLMSAIAVDATLQPRWAAITKLSSEKLVDAGHARIIARTATRQHRRHWVDALVDLFTKMSCIFGITTGLVWIFVKDLGQLIMYYSYIAAYTRVLTFQVSPLPNVLACSRRLA